MRSNTANRHASSASFRELEQLLGSKARARLLTILHTHPTQEFRAADLINRTGMSGTAVRYELNRLCRIGVVLARHQGREAFYRVHDDHPLHLDLKSIVYKTAALGDTVQASLGALGGIEAAFIYGSVAKGNERVGSDIDLFIIGRPNREQLDVSLQEAEDRLRREINIVVMTPEEWRRRREAGDAFLRQIMKSPRMHLIGETDAIR